MQTNILWSGKEYGSLEHCTVTMGTEYIDISSVIIGSYKDKVYRVEYYIKTSPAWDARFCEIKAQVNGKTDLLRFFKHTGEGWTINGVPYAKFNHCIDLDLPLTPFTNSLPLNRLNLHTHEESEVEMLYIDILRQQVKPVKQRYTKLSETEYRYENVPNDFEAVLRVDNDGFVIDYPGLFVQSAKQTITNS